MSSVRACLLLSLIACGGAEVTSPASPEADPSVLNEGKPWVTRQVAKRKMVQDRERMRLIADGGGVDVSIQIDGRTRTWSFPVELAALQIGDVPTLAYPIGWVKLDTLGASGDLGTWNKQLVDTVLRRLGSPIQLVLDINSVSEMDGRLVEAGSEASGTMLGRVQVGDRAYEIDVPANFQRSGQSRLEVDVAAFTIPVEEVALQEPLEAFRKLIGARRIGDTLTVSGRVAFSEFTGDRLPSFVRTPLTVNSVDEIREEFERQIVPTDLVRARLIQGGLSVEQVNRMSEAQLMRLRAAGEGTANDKQSGARLFKGILSDNDNEVPVQEAPQRRGYIVVDPDQ